ncbi:HAD family hydrolase [Streptomyces cellostaticus]|uniref:HAD family hydrolase n=1 Tax=Streptomyces cellostaticus TaxID=67285 RepID=UPI0020270A74|nr:HAD family hydrolase [Streptomyces cellostaticus]
MSFDLDGTLCDHKAAVQRSFDATLCAMESLLADVPAADVRRCFASVGSRMKRSSDEAGKPWWPVRDQWAETLREAGVVCSADELDQVTEVFTRTLNDTAIVFPGARRALMAVRRTGLPVGVLTNGERETQLRKLRACGLAGLVDQVVVSGDLGVHKPDAGAFRAVAHALGVPLSVLVHVGDDLVHDVSGALAAGAWAVWVSPSGTPGHGSATASGFPGLRAFELKAVPALLEQSRHSP